MKETRDRKRISEYLSRFKLAGFFEEEVNKLFTLHNFERGEDIFTVDERPEYLYFLVKGKVKISILLRNGNRVLLRFCVPLSLLGDLEIANEFTVKTSVSAVSESELLALRLSQVRENLMTNPAVLRLIIRELSFKLYHNAVVKTLTSSAPLKIRIASYLLLMTSNERNEKMLDELETESQAEIAELLGASYRHVNRVLNELDREGILRVSRSQIRIVDYDKLKNLASDLYG
ncbi:MAG: cyclic nucleotide-binding domain-containing protein [Mesotoga sp.]|uniref:helix-turn-helix domain-containing protein n=2 Tax=Mesotoga sp. TaxID=2053577 RepID=UPI00261FDA6B|nr:helix-turn-helix domain-containing protein [Mesotoga sp.]MDD4826307.1 cyclic nucleotide-binding domain-containing protein [Mesotoga sp.]MDD5684014.1 cyclic nucleotide-binding domain-containing protein [Mesotoga sp.]